MTIEGQPDNPDAPSRMHLRVVSPNYFGVVGMTLKQGRPFAGADAGDAPKVSIINEAAARRYWPGQDPVGKRWNFGRPKEGWTTVVGVVNDVRHWGLSQPVNPMVYLPLAQSVSNAMTFVVRTDQDAATFAASARATVKAFDPAMPTGTVDPLDAFVARSLRSDRAQTLLMGAFGALALLLAAVGIYGVMSQIVASRVQEIGIRLALGARSSHIVRLIVIGCAWQTVAGLTLGILAGASLAGLASTLLFGVSPWDPMTLTAVAIVLMAASMAACLIPVARALRVEAASAIRA